MGRFLPGVITRLTGIGGSNLGQDGILRITVLGRGDAKVTPVVLKSARLQNAASSITWPGPANRSYVVTAVNATGETLQSNVVSVATETDKEVVLTWNPIIGRDITSYRVWRNEAAGEQNEIQLITFSVVPTGGAFDLDFGGNTSGSIAFSDNAAAVATAIEATTGITDVTVTGDFTVGFTVEFVGVDGNIDHPQFTVNSNTLTPSTTITIATTQQGQADFPAGWDDTLIAVVAGELSSSYTDPNGATSTATFPVAATALNVPLNTFRTFTSMTDMRRSFGSLTSLGEAAQLAQNLGQSVLSAISVDFTGVDAASGDPAKLVAKQAAYQTAVNVLLEHDTDIVVPMDPEIEITTIVLAHVKLASDEDHRRERSAWASAGTSDTVGDANTADTLVSVATGLADRFVSVHAPVSPFAVLVDDAGVAAERALTGSHQALANAVISVRLPDEATPITNKTHSVFTRYGTNFNDADLLILRNAGVTASVINDVGIITIIQGVTTNTTLVEDAEINIVAQEHTLARGLREVSRFGIGLKNTPQVRLELFRRISEFLQSRIAQSLMTDFSGLEVIQDEFRPDFINVSFSHTAMFGVNNIFIDYSFDTRGGFGA